MKRAKQEIYISTILVVINLVLFALFQFEFIKISSFSIHSHMFYREDIKDFFVVIFSSVFVSAFMSLILAIRDYRITKDEILLEFFNLVNNKQRLISDLLLLDFDYSLDMVKGIINEEMDNALIMKQNNELKIRTKQFSKKKRKRIIKKYKQDIVSNYKTQILDDIWDKTDKDTQEYYIKLNKKNDYLNAEYFKIYNKIMTNINNVINSYSSMKNVYCDDLNYCISKIDFILPKRYKEEIHPIYDKVYNQISYIRKVGYYCQCHCLNGEYDALFLLHYIVPCQCSMIDEFHDGKIRIKYNRYSYEIDVALWNIIDMINRKKINNKPSVEEFRVSKTAYLKPYVGLKRII